MSYKVFFAYQMDIDDRYCKGFIQQAIYQAIDLFKKDNIDVILDFGFRGSPGNTVLIDEMLKKSKDSDLVIADLTFTSSKEWLSAVLLEENEVSRIFEVPKGDIKPSPNPNVLLETGYAWAQKGQNRTVIIMNTAFGMPDELPVDFKGLRWGIPYFLNDSNYSDSESIRLELSKDIYKAIKVAINSEAEYQREKWKPFQIHKDWKARDFSFPYRPTPKIKNVIEKLRNALKTPDNAQRIIGPKNCGKTRLAYELFKEIDNDLPREKDLELVLYYDLKLTNYSDIEPILIDLKHLNQRKVLIIDNCSKQIHDKVFDTILPETEISLLTIDESDNGGNAHFFIDKEFAEEVIQEIVINSIDSKFSNYVLHSSKSNIRNAISVVNAISQLGESLSEDYNERWNQILGNEIPDDKYLMVLEELSLFSYVGFQNELRIQSEFIMNLVNINNFEDFEVIVEKLSEKGIIKITGDFIVLEAFIDELANRKLAKLPKEDFIGYFEELRKVNLSKSFSSRLVEIRNSQGARALIENMVSDGGLLTKFEIVDTKEGSQLIMNLSELEPIRILEILQDLFFEKSTADLQEFKRGRRNIVWALERLVFRKDTFFEASKLLFRLSVGENENIGNNATSQFIHLFQIFLPGTEVSLSDRIQLINELTAKNDSVGNEIIINALERALMVRGFVRMGGAEKQADQQFVDYYPKTKEEVDEYYQEVIEILTQLRAFDVVIDNVNSQINYGNRDAIFSAINFIISDLGLMPIRLRQQLDYVLHNSDNLPEDYKSLIEGILSENSVDSIREDLDYYVANAPMLTFRDIGGSISDKSLDRALALADSINKSENLEWIKDIDILLVGQQRLAFAFGERISTGFPDNIEIAQKVAIKLIGIPLETQNNSFIEGYLSKSTNQDFLRNVIDLFLSNPALAYHGIRITRLIDIEFNDLLRLFPVIDSNPNYVTGLQFFKLSNLSSNDLFVFIEKLKTFDFVGWATAISLMDSNFDKFSKNSEVRITIIRKLLIEKGSLVKLGNSNGLFFYQYVELLKKMDSFGLDDEFVGELSHEAIIPFNDFSFEKDYHLKMIVDLLLSKYWDIAWPIFMIEAQKEDFYGWYEFSNVLKNFRSFSDEKLLNWMDNYPNEAPQKIVQFLNVFEVNDSILSLNPLVLEMINRYFNNEQFLDSLSSVFHSYSISGSSIPLLENRMRIIEPLMANENLTIQKFANEEFEYFENKIMKEKIREENRSIIDRQRG